jgi:hypothetical protein
MGGEGREGVESWVGGVGVAIISTAFILCLQLSGLPVIDVEV